MKKKLVQLLCAGMCAFTILSSSALTVRADEGDERIAEEAVLDEIAEESNDEMPVDELNSEEANSEEVNSEEAVNDDSERVAEATDENDAAASINSVSSDIISEDADSDDEFYNSGTNYYVEVEPNNTMGSAQRVLVCDGSSKFAKQPVSYYTGTFKTGDVDFYRVKLEGGAPYLFYFTYGTYGLNETDVKIELINSKGQKVTDFAPRFKYNSNYSYTDSNKIYFKLEKGDDYYLKVYNFNYEASQAYSFEFIKELSSHGAITILAPVEPGWRHDAGGWWYQNADRSCVKSSWKEISGKWYHFNANGYMDTSKWIDGYYVKSDGTMAKSMWVGNYYLKSNGLMARNEWVDGNKYYVGSDGAWIPGMVKAGWKQTAGKWWYQNADGTYPRNCWKQISGYWYHFDKNGYMEANKWIGNYYVKSDGKMAVSQWVDGGRYYVGKDGAWVPVR